MEKYIQNVRRFFIEQTVLAGVLVIVILAGGFITYRTFFLKVTPSELATLMTDGEAYLKETRALKQQSLDGTISADDFNARGGVIEEKIAEINAELHSGKFSTGIEIDQHTLESVGDSLEGLVGVIFNEKDLKNLDDEILALSIIMEDVKDGKLQD